MLIIVLFNQIFKLTFEILIVLANHFSKKCFSSRIKLTREDCHKVNCRRSQSRAAKRSGNVADTRIEDFGQRQIVAKTKNLIAPS